MLHTRILRNISVVFSLIGFFLPDPSAADVSRWLRTGSSGPPAGCDGRTAVGTPWGGGARRRPGWMWLTGAGAALVPPI
ncbi:hypothetical protein SK128_004961 [Halocaridina rubra]|uniref:Secreted protein n=1 Tax=Halocaridina rubra TaxID=373956 RepID=A0AAN8WWY6_HALRR